MDKTVVLTGYALDPANAPRRGQVERIFQVDTAVVEVEKGSCKNEAIVGFPGLYEEKLVKFTIRAELNRKPETAFLDVITRWCDYRVIHNSLKYAFFNIRRETGSYVQRENKTQLKLKVNKLPEWLLCSDEAFENELNPYSLHLFMEHKNIQAQYFGLGSFLGLNTFVEHFGAQMGVKSDSCYRITQATCHFDHSSTLLRLYFVDSQPLKNDKKKLKLIRHRFHIPYSFIHKIFITKHSDTETDVYFHLLYSPLLFKVSDSPVKGAFEPQSVYEAFDEDDGDEGLSEERPLSRWGEGSSKSQEFDFDDEDERRRYVAQFEAYDHPMWDRVTSFGDKEGGTRCSSDVIGRSRVIAIKFKNRTHWPALSNMIHLCKRHAPVYYVPVKIASCSQEIRNVQKPQPFEDFSSYYALLCIWQHSFQITDELGSLPVETYKAELQKLRKMSSECSTAFEDACYEVALSLQRGNIIQILKAVQQLYEQRKEPSNSTVTMSVKNQNTTDRLVKIRKAILTPTKVLFLPPQFVCSSRMLRHFDTDFALKVVVRDENCDLLSFALGSNKDRFLAQTIQVQLSRGIKIASRFYEFLGCSTSQLRSHGLWFYAQDTQQRTADVIRHSIGDMSEIKTVSKLMARLGQAFSQSLGSIYVPRSNTIIEPDIVTEDPDATNVYVFSDGVGRISMDLMNRVYIALGLKVGECPSAIQIRYGGCKGMLALDLTLNGDMIVFRDSMRKFPSNDEYLFVLKTSSHAGIKAGAFMTLQNQVLDSLLSAMFDSQQAASILEQYCSFDLPYRKLAESGIDLSAEPFFCSLLSFIHRKILRELKTKARIMIPPSKGRSMLGVIDETGILEYGEVFVQYSEDINRSNITDPAVVLTGDVVVTKNPCMHPGDIRKLTAVDVPELHHIRDCIVFPQKGERPHTDEMAGSDLDGDEYSVLWHELLIFKENAIPMHYHAENVKESGTSIEVSDMIEFFCQFLKGDKIGMIANAHLVWADLLSNGIYSKICNELARKCSINLNYAKCGEMTGFQRSEKPPMYPDFMEKVGSKKTYCSKRVLGHLYRSAKRIEIDDEDLEVCYDFTADTNLLLPGRELFKKDAQEQYKQFAAKLRSIMLHCGVEHIAEGLSNLSPNISCYVQEKKGASDVLSALQIQMHHLFQHTRNEFYRDEKVCGSFDFALLKASAWYEESYLQKNIEATAFPWVVSDILSNIAELQLSHKKKLQERGSGDITVVEYSARGLKGQIGDIMFKRECSIPDDDKRLQILSKSLRIIRDWIEASKDYLNIQNDKELAQYRALVRDLYSDVVQLYSTGDDLPDWQLILKQPQKLLILCLKKAGSWVFDSFLENRLTQATEEEDMLARRRYRLGQLALITLNRVVISGNPTYLLQPFKKSASALAHTEIVRVYIEGEDRHFLTIVNTYEDVLIDYLKFCTGVKRIQTTLRQDCSSEWYLQMMVTGNRWAIERLKDIVIMGRFQVSIRQAFQKTQQMLQQQQHQRTDLCLPD